MLDFSIARVLTIVIAGALAACSSHRIDQPLAVASGFASHQLCSEVFISGFPADKVYEERIKPTGAFHLIAPLVHYQVDTAKQQVTSNIGGAYQRRAVYQAGVGCLQQNDLTTPIPEAWSSVAVAQASNVTPETLAPLNTDNPALKAALDHAFKERSEPPYLNTKAIVVMQHGQIIAERYAPGVTVDTPILGYSMTKSITNALLGILVREHKLDMHQPTPLVAWADPSDPHHAITPDQLLRQVAGLDLAQTNSGFDTDSRLGFLETDKAAAAAQIALAHPPGSHWSYSDGNFNLLSRVIRDSLGGQGANVAKFAHAELFAPLGMNHVTLEYDATGTPLGASYMFASARDWARFGQLYLNDGIINGKRILPEGWVKYSATRTLETGYGAGFWVNQAQGDNPWGGPWGMPHVPRDAFFAMGFMGQHTVIVPSQDLVVVKLGISHHYEGLIKGADRLVAEVISALDPSAPHFSDNISEQKKLTANNFSVDPTAAMTAIPR